jgi:hypothetical protein
MPGFAGSTGKPEQEKSRGISPGFLLSKRSNGLIGQQA